MWITRFGWKTCSNRFDTCEVRIEGECKYSFARFSSPNHQLAKYRCVSEFAAVKLI